MIVYAAKHTCYTNRSQSWSKYAPHVYFMNLEKTATRNLMMRKILQDFGYNYTRVNAITPKAMKNSKEGPLSHVVFSCTLSHLETIYTAVRDYKLNDLKNKKKLPYALIMEDDGSFLFDIRDWKGLIESAPTGWSILQISTSSAEKLKSSFEEGWINYRRQWQRRDSEYRWVYGTMSYLINMESPMIMDLFGNPTNDEKASFNIRLDHRILFRPTCNDSDLSMSSRLACKAYKKNLGYNVQDIDFPADYFIYHLGDPNTFFSTIPLLNFALHQESTIYNKKNDSLWLHTTRSIGQEAVKKELLPSYLSSTLCQFPKASNYSSFGTSKNSSVLVKTTSVAVGSRHKKIPSKKYVWF